MSGFSGEAIWSKVREVALRHGRAFHILTRVTWVLFFCFILGVPIFIYSVNINLLGLYGGMPRLQAIENPENDLSSELISSDGISLGRYFTYNRSQVTYDELSPDLVNTLVLSEDHRFFEHSGMDFVAYIRVLWGLLTFSPAGGGSTITQQLAKNLYTQNKEMGLDGKLVQWMPGQYPKRIIDKTKEWIISVYLERNFTKKEIIALYLNTSMFSSNAYGIRVASETYFNKQVDSLNIQESALLVGMLQAPTRFSPVLHPDNALRKRNEVIYKLLNYGYITSQAAYDSIRALPIELNYRVENQNTGLAPYFRSVIQGDLMRWCNEHNLDLWESGLKIYTTIDTRLQEYAEQAVAEHMHDQQADFNEHWKGRNPWIDDKRREIKGFLDSKMKQTETYRNLVRKYGAGNDSIQIALRIKKPMRIFSWEGEKDTIFSSMDSLNYYMRFLHAGFIAIDPQTGAVRAWVGGINHKYFQYDHVRQGKRQPGSTFKPFVYGTALEVGYNPFMELYDISPSFKVPGTTWYPPNADGTRGSGKKMTLRQAMARSINSITAQLIQRVGEKNVVDFAKRVGITSHLDAVPSLCLGVSDVSLYELVGAYCTFVNQGIHTEPYYITRIEDRNGNVLQNFVPKTSQAINEQTAYKMVYMLEGGVVEEGGTSVGISRELKEGNEIGGKTGTTNNASDGWYVGITHDLVAGAWVGGDERSIHYREWVLGQGFRTARPIWEKFMLKLYADKGLDIEKRPFRRPDSMDISLDYDKYHPADSVQEVQDPWGLDEIK